MTIEFGPQDAAHPKTINLVEEFFVLGLCIAHAWFIVHGSRMVARR